MSAENTPSNKGASGERAAAIVDAGKLKRKAIKALKRGRGRVMEHVDEIAAEAAQTTEGRTVLRVVILVRKPPRRRS